MSLPLADLGFVMLIDDSKVDNFINTKVFELSKRTQAIQVFDNAQKALLFLQTTEKVPNFIFLDIYMPYMDGFDFLEEFEKLPSTVKDTAKVMLLSSSFDTLEAERLKKYSWVYGYLVKPLTHESLNFDTE